MLKTANKLQERKIAPKDQQEQKYCKQVTMAVFTCDKWMEIRIKARRKPLL